MFWKEKY